MRNYLYVLLGMTVGVLLLLILAGVNQLCNDDREEISDSQLIIEVREINQGIKDLNNNFVYATED
jgi:hypothetical protein